MSQVFIYESDSDSNIGGISLCHASQEVLETYSILEIALKDTPTGKPFWIIDETEVSNDHTFFNAWELDLEALGEPDGYGMDYEDWVQEYGK